MLAVISAMGLAADQTSFVHQGLAGTVLRARVVGRTSTDASGEAIICELCGSAWITGEHTFVIDEDDPFREGFRL